MNPGTEAAPFATLDKAKEVVRDKTASASGDIRVYLREGTYSLYEPFTLTEADSGKNGHKVIYEAYPGEKPILDGGVRVEDGWELYQQGIYRTKLPALSDARELYVNGLKQQRSRSANIQSAAIEGTQRSFMLDTEDLPAQGIAHPEDLLYIQNVNWRTYMLPVEKMEIDLPWTKATLREPYITNYLTKFNFEMSYNAWAHLENALEFIDEPGEFYFDKRSKYLYYLPQEGINLQQAEVVVPKAEKLLNLSGSSAANKIQNVEIRGLTFRYAAWHAVNTEGYAHTQATLRVTEKGAYAEMLPAALNINYADNVVLERNVIEHIGASALNAENGLRNLTVRGNVFQDIAGGAVNVGNTANNEIDQPGEELPTLITISNNVLREIGVDYTGSPGITTLYGDTINIEHNDIDGVNYSGISIGWGWNKNATTLKNTTVGYNKIMNFSRKSLDGAAIYSLSRHENSAFKNNYVKNVFSPFNTAALYHDEGSRGFVDTDNVLDIERGDYLAYNLNNVDDVLIRNLYTTTGNVVKYKPGPNVKVEQVHIHPTADWPAEAKQIIAQAGIEPEYQDLLAHVKTFPQEPRPNVRSSGINYVQSLSFEPRSTIIREDDLKAPFLEENGRVVFDAKDYTGYKGLEAADFSFIGVLGWFGGFASKFTLMTKVKEIERTETYPQGKPTVSYRIQFQSPGTYHLLIRGKSASVDGKIVASFGPSLLGAVSLPIEFAFVQKTDAGSPLTVQVDTPGEYTLTLQGVRGDIETFLDKIALVKELTEELKDGSTAPGPQNSKRAGVPEVLVPLRKVFPSFTAASGVVNSAAGRAASSSSNAGEAYTPGKANDLSVLSFWRSAAGEAGSWWQVDFGQGIRVSELELTFPIDNDTPSERRSFEVRGSNDPTFATYQVLGVRGADAVPYKEKLVLKPSAAQSFRYLRIAKTAAGEGLGIAEMKAAAWNPELRNFALNRPVSASSNPDAAPRAVDGNAAQSDSTHWYSTWGQNPAWFQVDLGTSVQVTEIRMKARYNTTAYESANVTVYGSDTEDFSTKAKLAEHLTTNQLYELVLPVSVQEKFQYIRVEKQVANSSLGFSEFEVWGIVPQPTDALYAAISDRKPVKASSYLNNNPQYAPQNGNDGNTGSVWVSEWRNGEYWQVDLGSSRRIDKLQIVPRDGASPGTTLDFETRNYKIFGSNTEDFAAAALLATIGSTPFAGPLWSYAVTDPGTYRYVRIQKTAAESGGFKEFRVLSADREQTMNVTDRMQLAARIDGEDIPAARVTWNSTNQGTAAVATNGQASALRSGKITVTGSYNGKSVAMDLTITDTMPITPPATPDIFQPFLMGTAPVITQVLSETTAESGAVKVTKVLYQSDVDAARSNQVYAVIAAPAAAGSYPGVLILHGGTECTQDALAIDYAKRGYVAVTPELPGITDPKTCVTPSTGLWKNEPYGAKQLTALPNAGISSIFEGEVAALQGFYLLQAQPGVKQDRLGIRGLSWGGYSATLLSSLLGDQVKAAYSIYGSGFYDRGSYFAGLLDNKGSVEKANWLRDLDAGRRADHIKADFYLAAASNDTYFWPTAVMKTLDRIPGAKNQVFAPNANHSLSSLPNAAAQERLFFDYHLKGAGAPLPKVNVISTERLANQDVKITFQASGAAAITQAKLVYSGGDKPWVNRSWVAVDAVRLANGRYEALLPAAAVQKHADWYVLISDDRQASASSCIYNAADTVVKPADMTAPVTAAVYDSPLSGSNGWLTGPVILALTAADEESSVTNTVYRHNGGSWTTYAQPLNLTDGTHQLEFYSIDEFGNQEEAKTFSLRIDSKAPVIGISSPMATGYGIHQDLTIDFTLTDDLSGVDPAQTSALLNGKPVINGAVIPLYTIGAGEHQLVITGSDLAGNQATSASSFQVSVSSTTLKQLVRRFHTEGRIDNAGIADSLINKLEHGQLQPFKQEVQAQRGKHISEQAADILLRLTSQVSS
nr:discoidin domain-containing protein [Paenibacillus hamazuiensis]